MARRLKTTLPLLALLIAAVVPAHSAASVTLESKYPGLSSGALRNAAPALVKGALLEVDGITITSKDLTAQIAKLRSPAKEQFTSYQFVMLENMAIRKLIEKEASAWALGESIFGLEGEKLIREYVTHLVGQVTVTDEEAQQFYKDFPGMVGTATFEQAKSAIKGLLQEQKVNTLLNKHIDTLSTRHTIRISDIWAKQQYGKWIKNPVEAARRSGKPTLVKFGSDRCMPCRALAPIIKELHRTHEAKLNMLDLNSDQEATLSTHYGVQTIPLMIFYDKDGKETSRLTGYNDKAVIEGKLAELGVK